MADAETFDCFLSHNSRDKPAVRVLAAELRKRELTIWLDEDQLRPGLPWQEELERGIRASRSVAVLVGADGVGPWEQKEMRAALNLAVRNGRPVIPVLLADAPRAPELPLFLQDHTWVDLRTASGGADPSGIDRLVWGITGCRPGEEPPPPPGDEVSRRVSALRESLFLARSAEQLQLLDDQVKELQARFGMHPDLSHLARDLGKALAATRRPAPRPAAYPWARAGAWAAGLAAVGIVVWIAVHMPDPGPLLVNQPTPGWISEWTGDLQGLTGGTDTPVAVRLHIGADQSRLTLVRRDGVNCTTPVGVEVPDGRASIRSPGPIACPDGRALGELALSCREASSGGANCAGLYTSDRTSPDRPIRIALARVGGGAWPAPAAVPATPVEPPPVAPAASPPPALPTAPGPTTAPPVPADPAVTPADTAVLAVPTGPSASGGLPVITHPLKSGGQAPEMIAVPAGCFMMGSPPDEPERYTNEGPQHRVCVSAFAIGRTEVTFAQYDRFATATRRRKPGDQGWGRGDRPVIDVSWDNAVAYTEWLSGETGHSYRLPTEAEWEYAARAGTAGPFWTGDCIHTDQANYNGGYYDYADCGAKTRLSRGQTVPTGSLPPNPWGLHEVAGNVWEWCLDGYQEDFYAQCQARGQVTDPLAPAAGGSPRVLRGGSFAVRARNLRASSRVRFVPGFRGRVRGFRCVLAAPRQPLPSIH